MTDVALSSGCFTGHLRRLPTAGVKAVELASHSESALRLVLADLRRSRTRVISVHAPCPGGEAVPNLAAEGESRRSTFEQIRGALALAEQLDARFVVVHAFYCTAEKLPMDDLARMEALRRQFAEPASVTRYRSSEEYQDAKVRTIENLKELLPDVSMSFPRQTILLENLNPRVGYGGIALEDVARVAADVDGAVGVCLDLGHLTLSAAALGRAPEHDLAAALPLVSLVHVHQNFGGRYFLDRNWDEAAPRAGLQEVDAHLPLLTRYVRADVDGFDVTPDNSAFSSLLAGPVRYAAEPQDGLVSGAVPLNRLLPLLPDVPRVLEFDSRYAPIDEILDEYLLARSGDHPAPW